jgi:hypothetical protein
MASSHRTDRVSARRDLKGQSAPCLHHACPPPPGAGEHFQPADWLRDRNMFSVHSKPNGQNRNGLADHDIIRKWSRTYILLIHQPVDARSRCRAGRQSRQENRRRPDRTGRDRHCRLRAPRRRPYLLRPLNQPVDGAPDAVSRRALQNSRKSRVCMAARPNFPSSDCWRCR